MKAIKVFSIFIMSILPLTINCQEQPDIGIYTIYHPLVNPASNGSFETFSTALFGRKQWYSIEGSPALIGFQIIQPFNNISLGASLTQEMVGVHSKQKLFVTYSHNIKIQDEHSIAFGLSPGLTMLQSNYNKVVTSTGTDSEFQGSKSIIRPDFNFGVYYYSKKYFGGISIPSLIKNTIVESDGELSGTSQILPSYWHYYFFGGYNYFISDAYKMQFSTLVKKVAGTALNADVNLLIDYDDNFGIGISYSTKKEILLSGKVNISPSLQLAYCFHSYFNVKKQMLAGHEIFITYSYLRSKQATIQSPRF